MEEIVYNVFLEMLKEDLPFGDITTEKLIPETTLARAVIKAKQDGVVACIDDLAAVLEKMGIEVRRRLRDGEQFSKGDIIMELVGSARKILMLERTVLNLLMRCSGIATSTRNMVVKARRVNPNVRIAATRKTSPLLRYFEKKAVLAGGGDTHRFSLSDAVLIKKNHLRILGDVSEAVRRVREKTSFAHKVEVEVSTIEEALKAVEAGADIVMLDNVQPSEIRAVVEELKRRGLRERVLLEASGGINLENVEEYAKTGVDVISCGWITMSSPAIDMSLEIVEVLEK
ncbi:MAG: carboxylating nicotinate-nucleotide diphosphorylase [Acidilobaceae archaeon]